MGFHGINLWAGELGGASYVVRLGHFLAAWDEALGFSFFADLSFAPQPEEEECSG